MNCVPAVTRSHQGQIRYRSEITALLSHTSARILIIGIDQSGRINQHDRSSLEVLAPPGEALIGAHLSDLVTAPAEPGSPLQGLLDAARSGREATAVLTLRTRRSDPVDAVVSIQPMRGSDDVIGALVIMRMPPPADEQFLDPALMRHALLDDTFRQIGATLDLDQMARGLINIVVPHFCNSAGLLMLESMVTADEPPGYRVDGSHRCAGSPSRATTTTRGWTRRSPPVKSCGTRREPRTPSAWTPASRCGRSTSRRMRSR